MCFVDLTRWRASFPAECQLPTRPSGYIYRLHPPLLIWTIHVCSLRDVDIHSVARILPTSRSLRAVFRSKTSSQLRERFAFSIFLLLHQLSALFNTSVYSSYFARTVSKCPVPYEDPLCRTMVMPQDRMEPEKNYSLAIVGGGIGGLCTVIGLLKQGVDVHIYEGIVTIQGWRQEG